MAAAAPAHVAGIEAALPSHRLDQDAARAAAARLFGGRLPGLDRLLAVYDHAGIRTRYCCMPLDWYLEGAGFAERNRLFVEHAERLLADATRRLLERLGLGPREVDAVVCVTSTGIATPSLDARLAERLGLRAEVERTPLFGLGCAGGVLGLARAATLARARPGSRVLLLVTELCSLALRRRDVSKANLVACALFGDAAAALLLTTEARGAAVVAGGEHRLPDSLDVMGWRIEDDGLGVLFSPAIPEIAREAVRPAAVSFLARHGRRLADLDAFAVHPGGARVLEALAEALALPPRDVALAAAVLRETGNVSAVSVLLVLQRLLARHGWRRALALALGPGFTVGFALLERRE